MMMTRWALLLFFASGVFGSRFRSRRSYEIHEDVDEKPNDRRAEMLQVFGIEKRVHGTNYITARYLMDERARNNNNEDFNDGVSTKNRGFEDVVTVTKEVPIGVPRPYQVTVTKSVEVPVLQPYLVHVPKPYPVPVRVQVPIPVPKPIPVRVIEEVPIKVPVYVKVPLPIRVPIPKPYPVEIVKHVPVRVPTPVYIKVPVYGNPKGITDHLPNKFNNYRNSYLTKEFNGYIPSKFGGIYGKQGYNTYASKWKW